MARLLGEPVAIPVPGGKQIDEHVGRVATATDAFSLAHMVAPPGWTEPGQRPEFDEYTLVLRGSLRVEHDAGQLVVTAGRTVLAEAGEWVRYSTGDEECEYVALCVPAFAPGLAHRDEEV